MHSVPETEQADLETMEVDAVSAEFGGGPSTQNWAVIPKIDDTNIELLNKPPIERFIGILDQLDSKVEMLRKEALVLQEKKDFLAMSMDLLKNNEYLTGLNENEYEEINCYVQRISGRLATVELSVCTVRDRAQEDSLHLVNSLIDEIISGSDAVVSRLRCQQFLNACSTTDTTTYTDLDPSMCLDKKFESALLGCTLDDQKTIKKRLQALLDYLIKQTVVH
ncbi:BAG family molecular chaperone regulator 2-like isoform X1 [Armigeres subalbatus]|uniref:BAG family molecular chaperone regulator 2-like isoform X1 n=1 Tax=Armigeres subalbatus TaxID=124917 RepID=UPI002ED16926